MKTIARWAGLALLGLIALAIVAAGIIWIGSERVLAKRVQGSPERLVPATPASLPLGQHLLNTHGCLDCHGDGLRGRKFLDIPNVVTLHAPNITLIAAKANDQQLAQAIRQGIGHDGRPLYIMPSNSYSSFTDSEVRALIEAIRAQPRGGRQQPGIAPGPLGRLGLLNGKLPGMPEAIQQYRAAPAVDLGPRFAAGRHTAMTICADCHGSSLDGKEFEPGTMAPSLDMAGAYDLPDFAKLLRTGVPPDGRDLKVMDDVSRKAFRHFTDAEIAELHAYLQARAQR